MNERLIKAVRAVYFAAHWRPDRTVENEVELWTELRDAAGIEPGHAPKPRSVTPEAQKPQPSDEGPTAE